VYLPTYGMFDEGRYFAPGREPPPVIRLPSGWRVGVMVCEDFWHPSLAYLLALQAADVILVLAAAPGRGEPGDPRALFASTEPWLLLARAAAVQYGVYVVIANRVGVEGGITFAGESLVVSPTGEVLASAPQGEPWTLNVTLTRGVLRRSRTPFSHLRDEDPSFLRRALESLEGGSDGEHHA
jgi:predicted amidohydrolase